jgi:FkbM family methyltransferase
MESFGKEYQKILSEIPTSPVGLAFDELKNGLGGRPLVLYGAGRMAGLVLEYCGEYGLPVACVCDRSKTGTYGALPIIDPQMLRRDYPQAKVAICSFTFGDEIYSDLTNNGFLPEQIAKCPSDYPCFETPLTFVHYLDGYRWAYDFFEDDLSRLLVLDGIRMCLLGAPMRPNTACDMHYEDGLVSLADNEVFVDGGGYDGDTTEMFIGKMRSAGNIHSRAYAFEPNPASYAKATQRLSVYKNVEIVPKGLWSEQKELFLFENTTDMLANSFVFVWQEGRTVPVTSLDAFFGSMSDGELPTFIKMNIEGAEREALLGAVEIIRRKKPKLSICARHKTEDIYELPRTIMDIRDDYRLALRHHGTGAWNTVLYAV